MGLLGKSKRAFEEGGLGLFAERSFNHLYRQVSRFLPHSYSRYNDVEVPSHKFLGSLVPEVDAGDKPNYERGIVNSLEDNVDEGDEVVILGGGIGVSAVTAFRNNGKESNITVFEGSESQIEKLELTFKKNECSGIDLRHAVVGPEKDVLGSSEDADRVKVSEIPECDVLEVDIEGSELEVLENLDIRPDNLIVESHGVKGAPTSDVKKLMDELSYEILNVELAENNEYVEENDIRVVTGKYKEGV